MRDQGLAHGGHGQEDRRLSRPDRRQGGGGVETGLNGDRGAGVDGRRGMDVHAAYMEHGQHGQGMITVGDVLGRDGVDGIVKQGLLGQHRAFRAARGAGGIDDGDRVFHGAAARIGAASPQQIVIGPPTVMGAISNKRRIGHFGADRIQMVEKVRLRQNRPGFAVLQDPGVLGCGQAPIQGHQHGAQAGASKKQLQQFRAVVA